VIDTLKTMLAPFLPFTCQKLHSYLGYDGEMFGRQYTEEIHERERRHLALRYDPAGATGRWAVSTLAPGQALREPAALFLKLEPSVIDAEIERMTAGA
jgi:methionyl-tRNA synthetase